MAPADLRPADAVGRCEDAAVTSLLGWLAGAVSGLLGAMGMGGGGVLVIWLTLGEGMEQAPAQGVNLLLFIPCAIPALISYSRKKLIQWKVLALCVFTGLAGALLGVWLSALLEPSLLRKIFGAMLLLMGIRELFPGKKQPKSR